MNQPCQDATTFAKAILHLSTESISFDAVIEPLLEKLAYYLSPEEVQALEAKKKAQAAHLEAHTEQMRHYIEQFALHAPKFP